MTRTVVPRKIARGQTGSQALVEDALQIAFHDVVVPVSAGDVVARAAVYGGAEPDVPLVGKGSIEIFVPKGAQNCPTATVTYRGPLRPPVLAGQEIGRLNVYCNDQVIQATPLYAANDVGEGDIVRKASDALKQLLLGWL